MSLSFKSLEAPCAMDCGSQDKPQQPRFYLRLTKERKGEGDCTGSTSVPPLAWSLTVTGVTIDLIGQRWLSSASLLLFG